jgi:CRISPR-associated protein (TIGR02584 family)
MKKNILLLVTGMSPAIVTETIYGLAVNPSNGQEKWIPDEVHIISTEHGLNQIRERLINQGNFQKLLDDYDLPQIKFGEEYFYPIRDVDGKPQLDLRTPADNERAANLICEKVRFFTSDKNEDGSDKYEQDKVKSLHVSIAGGRKTMGFYIGYALSLYGRANDHMSHVLVEAAFDETKVPDFYYPTPYKHQVKDYSEVSWNAQDAKIWLSYIPFVRLRASLPEESLIRKANFSDVVNAINLANNPLKVTLNIKDQSIKIGNISVRLSAREFAFYHWIADQVKNNKPIITAPNKHVIVDKESLQDIEKNYPEVKELASQYIQFYDLHMDEMNAETVKKTLKYGMDRNFFNERKATLRKIFKTKFGEALTEKIEVELITKILSKGSEKLSREQKNALIGQYSLNLKPEQIEIIK